VPSRKLKKGPNNPTGVDRGKKETQKKARRQQLNVHISCILERTKGRFNKGFRAFTLGKAIGRKEKVNRTHDNTRTSGRKTSPASDTGGIFQDVGERCVTPTLDQSWVAPKESDRGWK